MSSYGQSCFTNKCRRSLPHSGAYPRWGQAQAQESLRKAFCGQKRWEVRPRGPSTPSYSCLSSRTEPHALEARNLYGDIAVHCAVIDRHLTRRHICVAAHNDQFLILKCYYFLSTRRSASLKSHRYSLLFSSLHSPLLKAYDISTYNVITSLTPPQNTASFQNAGSDATTAPTQSHVQILS